MHGAREREIVNGMCSPLVVATQTAPVIVLAAAAVTRKRTFAESGEAITYEEEETIYIGVHPRRHSLAPLLVGWSS